MTITETSPVTTMKIICKRIMDEHGKNLTVIEKDGQRKAIVITNEWTEVFNGVKVKAMFSGKEGQFAIHAIKDSEVDVHSTLPKKWIFVAYGEHENTVTGKVYQEDDSYVVESKGAHGLKFNKDSKLIIHTELNYHGMD